MRLEQQQPNGQWKRLVNASKLSVVMRDEWIVLCEISNVEKGKETIFRITITLDEIERLRQ